MFPAASRGHLPPVREVHRRRSRADAIAGTPSVFIQGKEWDQNANPDFVAFVNERSLPTSNT